MKQNQEMSTSSLMSDVSESKSPCNNQCRLEEGICLGCGRTEDEIFL